MEVRCVQLQQIHPERGNEDERNTQLFDTFLRVMSLNNIILLFGVVVIIITIIFIIIIIIIIPTVSSLASLFTLKNYPSRPHVQLAFDLWAKHDHSMSQSAYVFLNCRRLHWILIGPFFCDLDTWLHVSWKIPTQTQR